MLPYQEPQLCGIGFGTQWWVEAGKRRGQRGQRNRKEMVIKDQERRSNLPLWWQNHSNLEDRNAPSELVGSGLGDIKAED